jgi:hypothetical protein
MLLNSPLSKDSQSTFFCHNDADLTPEVKEERRMKKHVLSDRKEAQQSGLLAALI